MDNPILRRGAANDFFPGKTDDDPLNNAVIQKTLSLATAEAGVRFPMFT